MQRMLRTQMYLDPDLNSALERLAQQRGVSKAHLLRLAARRFLEQEQDTGEEDPIMGLIGLGHSGSGRGSVEHDQILVEQAGSGPRS